MSAFPAPPSNPNLEQLKDETRVTLIGLKTDSMNGLTGTALRLAAASDDGEEQRYVVRLDADGKSMKIKADNLVVTDGNKLEQLKADGVALEAHKKYEDALAKFEEVLAIQQRDLPVGHPDTHETLTSIDRCIDQLKYASIDNMDVARSGLSLFLQSKHHDSYRLFEQTYQRQLVTHGADHRETLATRFNMACSLLSQKR
jgi:tetratricopeptide (TPR) repeat protein